MLEKAGVRDAAHLIVSLSGGDGDIAQCAPRHVGRHPAEEGRVVLGVHILLLLDTGRHRQGVHTRLPGNIKQCTHIDAEGSSKT